MTPYRHALEQLAEAASAARAAPLFGAREDLLTPVLAASSYLRAFLARHPAAAAELAALPPVRTTEQWSAWLAEKVATDGDDASFMRALRIARQQAMLGITARELVSGDPLTTGTDLSGLAAASLELAMAQATREMRARHGEPKLADGSVCTAVVIGMGKLGGGELNYSSDIDVLFAYAGDVGQTDGAQGLGQAVDLHTYFARLFAKTTQLLSEVTEEGFVFRVDLDLRPEGRTGPICNSADGLESYYESFGHAWERLAWLKARPVAGDLKLGERIVRALVPFVYRKHLDYGFADEVAAMKRRIDQSGARLGHKDGFNVKLGRGGIREVEFAVQTLQLTWGGRLPELRCPDTKTALQRLALAGLLDQAEADHLLGAYRFLRRIEHAVQMQDDRQTHLLPDGSEDRRAIAATLGLDEAKLEATLAEHRKRVRHAFEAVVAGNAAGEDATWDATFAAALEPELTAEQREDALKELGFKRPADTRVRFEALARRPESPFHARAATSDASLAKKVVKAALATADADAALAHFESLFRTFVHRRGAFEQLDQDPRRLRTLAGLFGASHTMSRLIVRSPGLLERLVLDGKEPPFRTRAQLRAALSDELAANALDPNDRDQWYAALRRFKQAETLRIGFFDLAGIIDATVVSQQLSDLAEVLVEALAEREGATGIIALGALAGRELGYAGELELVFVTPPATDPAAAARAARAVVTGLTCATPEGTLYPLASGPAGTPGLLSVAADRLLEHHRADAVAWERRPFLAARAIVDATSDKSVQALVAELRARAFGAHDGSVRDHRAHPLFDLARFVQDRQLAFQPAQAELARRGHAAGAANLADATLGLARLGVIDQALADRLLEAWRFVRHLDNRLALVQEHPADSLRLLATEASRWDADAREHLRRLALRMGYGDEGGVDPAVALQKDLARHRATLEEPKAERSAT